MKPTFRTMLAFLAGSGLTLLLLLVTRDAPSLAPQPPTGSVPPTRRPMPSANASRTNARSHPSRPVPSRGLPADADEGAAATELSPASAPVGPAATPAEAGVTAGLGGRYTAKPGSKVRIEGTSNVHDWQVEGNIIGGHAELAGGLPHDLGRAQPGPVEAEVQASIPVRSLKSVNLDGTPFNAKMDDIMYGLLLEPTVKSIQFTLETLIWTGAPPAGGQPFTLESKGQLMVAGVTNTITMPVRVTPLLGDKLRFSGHVSVKMTDFGIQPPRPLNLGITTGDDVKVSFDWVVGRKPADSAAP